MTWKINHNATPLHERVYITEWHITGDCPECEGMGWFENCSSPWIGDTSCPVCDGTGEHTDIETLYENIEGVREDYPHGEIERVIRCL